MKRILSSVALLLLILVACTPVLAREYASPGESLVFTLGDLVSAASETVLSVSTGFEIIGRLTVSRTDQLVIEPGTYVRIRLPFPDTEKAPALIVDGSVEAVGTAAAPIIFEATPNNSAFLCNWKGIYNRSGSGPSHYQHCVFRGGSAAVLCRRSAPEIRDCTFSGQRDVAIAAWAGGAPVVVGNLIENATPFGQGISLSGDVTGCRVEDNVLRRLSYGMQLITSGDLTLRRNRVEEIKTIGTFVCGGGRVTLVEHACSACADGILVSGTDTLLTLARSRITGCTFTGLLQLNYSMSRLADNWIYGNGLGSPVWGDGSTGGIQVLEDARVDLGSATAPGHNFIFGNEGGNLLNFTENSLSAVGNRWDSPCLEVVGDFIWDASDDGEDADGSGFTSGPVSFVPVWTPRRDLFVLGRVWLASDELWDLAPNGMIDEDDLIEFYRMVR